MIASEEDDLERLVGMVTLTFSFEEQRGKGGCSWWRKPQEQ